MNLKDSKFTTLMEIKTNYDAGIDISYGAMTKNNIALMKRACRYYGTWEMAVNLAGINYDNIRKYKRWDREKIIEKIKEYYNKEENLSWRFVSLTLDPKLAAATLHGNRFKSWNEALITAGIPIEKVSKYKKWTKKIIQEKLEKYFREGKSLKRNSLAQSNPKLLAAIYRVGRGLVAEREILFKRIGITENQNKYRIKTTQRAKKAKTLQI